VSILETFIHIDFKVLLNKVLRLVLEAADVAQEAYHEKKIPITQSLYFEYVKSFKRRKMVGSILGAMQDKGQCRRRYNFELYKLYDEPDSAKYIKINRLKWAGHVIRMVNNWITKRMFNTWPEGKKRNLKT
jgi:hypothetical protein